MLRLKFSDKPWPASVSLNVTKNCNLRCKHCYAMLESHDHNEPTFGQLAALLRELRQGGTLSIRVLGGEPLVRKDLPELIKTIKELGMFCEVVTNGTMLEKRIAEWPELALVDSFSVSLDGDEKTHDEIRGKGSFKKTVDGILALQKSEFPVRIHAAMTTESYGAKNPPHKFLAEFSKKHDIPFNVATYCPNPEKGTPEDAGDPTSFHLAGEMYQEMRDMLHSGVRVTTTDNILQKGVDWFNHTNKYIIKGDDSALPPGHKRCMAGFRNCFIDSDGNLYTCIPHWKKGISVFEHGVEKAIEYAFDWRNKFGCAVCYNLAQWEYSRLMTLSDLGVISNVGKILFKHILMKKQA